MGRKNRNFLKLLSLSIFFIAVLAGCESVEDNGKTVQMVSPDEMETLTQLDETQLIDVRSLKQYKEGHIKGAQNLILGKDFKQRFDELDKTKPVAVYCKTGGQSKKCAQILKDAGFKKVFDLRGGLTQWIYEGKETVNQTTID
jgi:rhodanese-related sulfurtransferase